MTKPDWNKLVHKIEDAGGDVAELDYNMQEEQVRGYVQDADNGEFDEDPEFKTFLLNIKEEHGL